LKKALILSLLTSMLLSNSPCSAASTENYEQYQTAKRQEEQQQRQIKAPSVTVREDTGEDAAERSIVLPKEPNRFRIKEFVIDTGRSGKFSWLVEKLEPYQGRRIGAAGIDMLVKLLSEELMARGYITTRLVVPEQELKTGILRFQLIPGYVEDIRFTDERKYGTWRTAFPLRPGDVLNIHDIEQGLEQMKRVGNQDANIDIKAGTKPGYSIILINVQRSKCWTAGMSIDDSGLKNTGRLQATGFFSLYNPTGLNDIFSYSYTKDAEHEDALKGSKNTSFYYSVPYGNYTFNVNRYYNEFYHQIPMEVPFESRGKTTTWDFGVQKVIYRDKRRKTQLTAKIIKRRKENYVNGEEVKVQRLNTAAYQVGVMQRQYVGQGMVDAFAYFQKGMPWFGAEPGLSDHQEGCMTTRYSLFGLNFYYGTPWQLGDVKARYSFTFRGQYTGDVLYGSDHFSIGGRYTVRGFSGANTLAAENGYILRNEVAFPLQKINLEPYLGVDYGRIWGPSDVNQMGNSLAGLALGLRGKIGKPMSYDVFMGVPIYKPKGFEAPRAVVGFSAYWQL
jgi:hemolysin activation/secretion protein